MAALSTKPTGEDVEAFLSGLPEPRQSDCRALARLMQAATGAPPTMWSKGLVGFGEHHYRYASGREGDWFEIGFSPRAKAITLYLTSGTLPGATLLDRLGPHTTGKGCLYVKRLADVDTAVLAEVLDAAVAAIRAPGAGDHSAG
jgi:hypothetical protein